MSNNNLMKMIQDMNSATPDFLDLKNHEKDEFLYFVYGDMKQGHRNHRIIEGASFYGKAITTGDNYLLKKTAPNGAPILFDLKNRWAGRNFVPNHMVGAVEGEVYGVPLRCLTNLDKAEDNQGSTERLSRFVTLLNPVQGNVQVSVFMHLGLMDFWSEVVNDITALPGVCTFQSGAKKSFYYIG